MEQAAQHTAPHKPWGVKAIVGGLLSFVVPQIVLSLVFVTMFGEDSLSSTTTQFYMYGLSTLVSLGLLVLLLRQYHATLRDLLLNKFKLRFVGYAVLGLGAYFILTTLLMTVAAALFPQIDLNQEQDLGFGQPTNAVSYVLIFITLVIIPPLVEELLFRGLVLKGLSKYFRPIAASLGTSILFGVAHGQVNVAIDTFALSLVLCFLVYHTKSLWPAIVLHGIKNSLAYIVIFILPLIQG